MPVAGAGGRANVNSGGWDLGAARLPRLALGLSTVARPLARYKPGGGPREPRPPAPELRGASQLGRGPPGLPSERGSTSPRKTESARLREHAEKRLAGGGIQHGEGGALKSGFKWEEAHAGPPRPALFSALLLPSARHQSPYSFSRIPPDSSRVWIRAVSALS